MPDSFVPITSGAHDSGATSFRPKVVTPSQGAGAFAPLHPASFSSLCPTTPAAQPAVPIVTPKLEGDRIIGVRIQCTCGQVIELAFSP